MINEVEILKEIDGAISFHKRHMLNIEQTGYKYTLGYHNGRLDQLEAVRKLIKNKSAQETATSKGTVNDINSLTQKQYSTDQEKSEIRKLVVEIFDLSLQLQEMTDGTIDWIDWREPGVPCVYVEYHGATAVLSVKIWENGFSAEQRPDYSTMLFLDNPNCMIEAGYLKEKLMGLLEERGKEQ